MATLRNSGTYNIGSTPPEIVWTIVRGDTASFKAYVTNDALEALYIPDWTIKMEIRREDLIVVTLTPTAVYDNETQAPNDLVPGEFLVSITSTQSNLMKTGDVFDIQMTNSTTNQVWTVAKGNIIVIEDVTK